MNLQQLSYVVAVAEQRHFTRAAQSLDVTQPSLSAAIQALEADLGAQLFDRARNNVSLTPAGEALLPIAKRVLADIEAARQEVASLVELRSGRIRLGATPSLCTGLLPAALRDFRGQYPGIGVSLVEGGSRNLIAALDAGDLDLALVILPLLPRDQSLTARPLLQEKLVLAASSAVLGDPARPVTPEAFRGIPLLTFRQGYDLRRTLEKACRDAGFEPWLVVEGGEMDAVVSMAEAGIGACLLPTTVAQRARLVSYTVDAPDMTRTVGIAYRRGVEPPGTVRALCDVIDEHLRDDPLADGVEVIGTTAGLT